MNIRKHNKILRIKIVYKKREKKILVEKKINLD